MKTEKFCEFEIIKKYFNPLTPYGKLYKEKLYIITDKKELNRRYDSIEKFFELRNNKRFVYDKIKYHLKNIPYIEIERDISDVSDIFIYKKFINNYYAIYSLLNKKIIDFFSMKWELSDLYNLLNIDGNYDNFYISDKYDERLKQIRQEISKIINDINIKKQHFLEKIKRETLIDINEDFVIVDIKNVKENFNNFFNIEFYDSYKIILKPKYPFDYIKLIQEKENKLKEEKDIEKQVISKIAKEINHVKEIIHKDYINIIEKIDIAISSCDMAVELNLKRPVFNNSYIKIKNGFYSPLMIELEKLGIKYTKLSFNFNKRLNVLHGSNMGGKTIVLKTLVLCQLMAQYGFFVPALEFDTLIFDDIFTILVEDDFKGLSSFAYEIYEYVKVMGDIKDRKVLIIMDEFAKTTNVIEATALINGIIELFSKKQNIYYFLSTHIQDIEAKKNLDLLRMKGFDRNGYLKYFNSQKNMSITEKIKLINKFMRYEILRVNNVYKMLSDAIDIAYIIGIEKDLYNYAIKYMEDKYEIKKEKN